MAKAAGRKINKRKSAYSSKSSSKTFVTLAVFIIGLIAILLMTFANLKPLLSNAKAASADPCSAEDAAVQTAKNQLKAAQDQGDKQAIARAQTNYNNKLQSFVDCTQNNGRYPSVTMPPQMPSTSPVSMVAQTISNISSKQIIVKSVSLNLSGQQTTVYSGAIPVNPGENKVVYTLDCLKYFAQDPNLGIIAANITYVSADAQNGKTMIALISNLRSRTPSTANYCESSNPNPYQVTNNTIGANASYNITLSNSYDNSVVVDDLKLNDPSENKQYDLLDDPTTLLRRSQKVVEIKYDDCRSFYEPEFPLTQAFFTIDYHYSNNRGVIQNVHESFKASCNDGAKNSYSIKQFNNDAPSTCPETSVQRSCGVDGFQTCTQHWDGAHNVCSLLNCGLCKE